MATVNHSVSTPNEIRSLGGEVLTRMPQGTVIGAGIGFVIGIVLCFLAGTGTDLLPGLENVPAVVLYGFLVLFCTVFFGFAGTLVGIGVPKPNPNPEQGAIKRWKRTVLLSGGKQEKIVYVPEEERKEQDREYHLN